MGSILSRNEPSDETGTVQQSKHRFIEVALHSTQVKLRISIAQFTGDGRRRRSGEHLLNTLSVADRFAIDVHGIPHSDPLRARLNERQEAERNCMIV
jgi:hypothetical protein